MPTVPWQVGVEGLEGSPSDIPHHHGKAPMSVVLESSVCPLNYIMSVGLVGCPYPTQVVGRHNKVINSKGVKALRAYMYGWSWSSCPPADP